MHYHHSSSSVCFFFFHFEALFEFIREQKMKGSVWNPTQSEFCDYMVQLQHIKISRTAPREYKIVNNNADSVNCTFFCQDNVKYFLDGVSLKKIKHKNGTIAVGKIKVGVSHLKLSLAN